MSIVFGTVKFDKRMTEAQKSLVAFLFGGTGYGLIELLWRGGTHPSMVLTGGACFMIIRSINRKLRQSSVFCKCVVCSAAITGVEFAVGCVLNVWLGLGVWDYSDVRFNVLGQICPFYSALWFLLSVPLVLFFSRLEGGTDIEKAEAAPKKRAKPLSFSQKV